MKKMPVNEKSRCPFATTNQECDIHSCKKFYHNTDIINAKLHWHWNIMGGLFVLCFFLMIRARVVNNVPSRL